MFWFVLLESAGSVKWEERALSSVSCKSLFLTIWFYNSLWLGCDDSPFRTKSPSRVFASSHHLQPKPGKSVVASLNNSVPHPSKVPFFLESLTKTYHWQGFWDDVDDEEEKCVEDLLC